MRKNKFERYVELSDDCVDQFEEAMENGIVLTEMELLDYCFKEALVFGNTRKNDIGFLGEFYAEYLEEVYSFREMGYNNSDILCFLKRVCFRGRIHGISKIKVSGYDENGTYYLKVRNCRTKEERTLEIKGIGSFTTACLAVITLVATDGLKEGDFKSFAEEYLLNVYKEISGCVTPEPYIYRGTSKSFRTYVTKSKSSENGKIIKFRVG